MDWAITVAIIFRSMTSCPKTIAIIGDGFSAAILVHHLIKAGYDHRLITVFGAGQLGLGHAYSTQNPSYRLNVRDDLMEIDPDHPHDFSNWAKANIVDEDAHQPAGTFYRRCDYGRYLRTKLNTVLNDKPIHQIKAFVTDIKKLGQGWQLTAGRGQYNADLVIFANGNPPSHMTFSCDNNSLPMMITTPWRGDWYRAVSADDDIVIIGGGLTAMDALLNFEENQHQGKITVICPKGLLPPSQQDWREGEEFHWPVVKTASAFLGVMARHLGKSDWDNPTIQVKFEQLRTHISMAWRRLPDAEQTRLAKHLSWLWQLLRYRAAPQTVQAKDRLSAKGLLKIINGRVHNVSASNDRRLHIETECGQSFNAHHAIIATGAARDTLLEKAQANGIISLKHGHARVDKNLNIVSFNDDIDKTAFALGPPTVNSRGDVIGASTIAKEALIIRNQIMRNAHG